MIALVRLLSLCVGVWFVRPSAFVRPSMDRSQSVRGVSERPPPAYLALDDVPSLSLSCGVVSARVVRPVVGLPASPSVVAYLSGKKINSVSTDPSALCSSIS